MKTEPRQLILLSWVTLQLQAKVRNVPHQVWRVKRLRSRMTL